MFPPTDGGLLFTSAGYSDSHPLFILKSLTYFLAYFLETQEGLSFVSILSRSD